MEPYPPIPVQKLVAALQLEALLQKFRREATASPEQKSSRGSPDPLFTQGARNRGLTSIAGSLRAKGIEQPGIEGSLLGINNSQCVPPLADEEVVRIAASVCRYPAHTAATAPHTLTDTGNAKRLVGLFGEDIRYVIERKCWYLWDGTIWQVDGAGQMAEYAKTTAEFIHSEAASAPTLELRREIEKHARNSLQVQRIKAMIELAKSDTAVVSSSNDFDQDDFVLGVPNGVIDLRKGTLRSHHREDRITMSSPVIYDPSAKCPKFLRFLYQVSGATKQDKELLLFLIRLMGYCLTGDTSEQALFFLYGSGANGKSTFLNVLREVLGPLLALQTPSQTFMQKRGTPGASNDLARLQGARAALTTEIDQGSFLDEALIKQMTGGEKIACRFLYGEYFEYDPKFKLLIAGNYKPVIRGDDNGVWRRLRLIPFEQVIPAHRRDPQLLEKLRAELPGILNLAIKGCIEWQKHGLEPPKQVEQAVAEYRDDMDLFKQWLDECCECSPAYTESGRPLFNSYRTWAKDGELKVMSNRTFSQKLVERGYSKTRGSGGVSYSGLRLGANQSLLGGPGFGPVPPQPGSMGAPCSSGGPQSGTIV